MKGIGDRLKQAVDEVIEDSDERGFFRLPPRRDRDDTRPSATSATYRIEEDVDRVFTYPDLPTDLPDDLRPRPRGSLMVRDQDELRGLMPDLVRLGIIHSASTSDLPEVFAHLGQHADAARAMGATAVDTLLLLGRRGDQFNRRPNLGIAAYRVQPYGLELTPLGLAAFRLHPRVPTDKDLREASAIGDAYGFPGTVQGVGMLAMEHNRALSEGGRMIPPPLGFNPFRS